MLLRRPSAAKVAKEPSFVISRIQRYTHDTRLKPPTYCTRTTVRSYSQLLFPQETCFPVYSPVRCVLLILPNCLEQGQCTAHYVGEPVCSARGSALFSWHRCKKYIERPRPRNAIVRQGERIRTRAFLTHKLYLAVDPSSWTPQIYTVIKSTLGLAPPLDWQEKKEKKI